MFTIPASLAAPSGSGITSPLAISNCVSWLRADLGASVVGGNLITWLNQVKPPMSAALTKYASAGWGSGGAASSQTIAGDGYITFSTSTPASDLICGLSHTDPDQSYASIQFGLLLSSSGSATYIFESGVQKAGPLTVWAPGDIFKVEVVSGVVKYYQNGSLLYTSLVAPTSPLLFDNAIYTEGATVTNATMVDGVTTLAPTWSNMHGVRSQGSGGDGWSAYAHGGSGPAYHASGGLNGQAYIHFDSLAFLDWGDITVPIGVIATGPRTVAVVVKLNSLPHSGQTVYVIYQAGGGYSTEMILDLGGYAPISFIEEWQTSGSMVGHNDVLDAVNGHVYLHTYDGTGSGTPAHYTASLDGTTKSVVASGAYGYSATSAIGLRGNATLPLLGDLHELVMYDRVLTGPEQTDLVNYLKARYAI